MSGKGKIQLIPPDEKIFTDEAQEKAEKVIKEWIGEREFKRGRRRWKRGLPQLVKDIKEWEEVDKVLRKLLDRWWVVTGCSQCFVESFNKFCRTRRRSRYRKLLEDKEKWIEKAMSVSSREEAKKFLREIEKEKIFVCCKACENRK